MYYGHASWIAVLLFGGTFLIRYLTSQRRHNGRPGRPGPPRHPDHSAQRSFAPPTRQGPADQTQVGAAPAPTGSPGFTGTAPGWFTDPFVRHEQRYWSGSEWTEHVTDGGVPGIDPR
jgi:hypothetical protein